MMIFKNWAGQWASKFDKIPHNIYSCEDRDWYWVSIYDDQNKCLGYFMSAKGLLEEGEVDDE
jgi:heat shock protein HspQ